MQSGFASQGLSGWQNPIRRRSTPYTCFRGRTSFASTQVQPVRYGAWDLRFPAKLRSCAFQPQHSVNVEIPTMLSAAVITIPSSVSASFESLILYPFSDLTEQDFKTCFGLQGHGSSWHDELEQRLPWRCVHNRHVQTIIYYSCAWICFGSGSRHCVLRDANSSSHFRSTDTHIYIARF